MSILESIRKNDTVVSFMLVGVGGQGTILASNVLAEIGLEAGLDVKKAEVHGMSQRGGSVVSHVRWGNQVYSPIIADGQADYLIAFEMLEAARFIDQLKPGGHVLVNDYQIAPVTVSSGDGNYPGKKQIMERVDLVSDTASWVNGIEIAESLGNAKAANVVLLGALSKMMDLPEETWLSIIEKRVPPKFIELNRKAFIEGRTF